MKKNSNGTVKGILLILLGIAIGGWIFDLFDFDLFFDGWWTLFIIIPSAVRFFSERGKRISALGGLAVGILLLLTAQDFIEWSMFVPLFFALIFVGMGLRMIVSGDKKSRKQEQKRQQYTYQESRARNTGRENNRNTRNAYERENARRENRRRQQWDNIEDAANYYFDDEYDYNEEFFEEERNRYHYESTRNKDSQTYQYQSNRQPGGGYFYQSTNQTRRSGRRACTAVLTGKEIRYHNEVFEGAMLSTMLGAIELNLSEAILYQDVVIEAKVLLGSLELTVPKNVRLVVNSTPILGGIDNRVKKNPDLPDNAVTIYLNAICILGGIDIKQ